MEYGMTLESLFKWKEVWHMTVEILWCSRKREEETVIVGSWYDLKRMV